MTLRAAFMITGTGVHDRPESVFRINWIGCSRSNGISVHDPPERAVTHEIVASELTPDDVGDVSEMTALLDQIDAEIVSMTADGAYDGETVYDALAERHPEAAVTIPPRVTAVSNESTATQRDRRIAAIEEHGRMN